MEELAKRYDPSNLESKWYEFWNENGCFEPNGEKDSFTIVIPPPNITAQLHMGHAFNLTMQDILIRYKRMRGFSTLWVPGEDHAGIATQNVVEKNLAKDGISRHTIGREKFLEATWEWANKYRKRIVEQIKAIGCSVDWSRERFTMDDGLDKAVRKSFVKLFKEGLIYRGKYIVNWCPRCGTVLSDEEVEHEDEAGHFWHIKYPIEGEDRHLVIATTRPETMLGDTAVAVHPSDERYKDLIGKNVILPLVGKAIPIVADLHADPEFGTGAVKVTPAHDPNDFQIGIRHNLEVVEIMDKDAKINENGGKYKGLDRYEARKQVVKDLEEQGYLIEIEDMTHSVGHCYRCHTIVEPSLSDQWYVKVEPMAKKAIKAVEDGEVKFHPERWKKVYLNWMNEIRDWCISRQLWWGHRIPVWYCQDCGEIIVEEQDPTACPKCGCANLKQDEDVLDTWFSSQLWPFTTLGWPEETAEVKKFYPTSTLVTAFDIIFFWVARMIMAGYQFMGDKPFSDVYIHQLIRDKQGRKMSKSLGNGIDPIEVIDEFGADPMRFTLAMLAAQGRDIKLDVNLFDTYKKFANKIWNATRFALMNLEGYEGQEFSNEELELEDRWILSRLQNAVKSITDAMEAYDFNVAAKVLYSFFWNEFCDWYIETIKPRLWAGGKTKTVAQSVLVKVLDNSFRLMHPFMPFMTEELWQKLPVEGKLLINSDWPEYNEAVVDNEAEATFNKLMEVIRGIRNVRAEMNIPPSSKASIYYVGSELSEEDAKTISHLSNCDPLEIKAEKIKGSATAYGDDNLSVYLSLGEMDIDAEIKRLEGKLNKETKEMERLEKKLSNKKFIDKAPEEVVLETREKLAISQGKCERISGIISDLR